MLEFYIKYQSRDIYKESPPEQNTQEKMQDTNRGRTVVPQTPKRKPKLIQYRRKTHERSTELLMRPTNGDKKTEGKGK